MHIIMLMCKSISIVKSCNTITLSVKDLKLLQLSKLIFFKERGNFTVRTGLKIKADAG